MKSTIKIVGTLILISILNPVIFYICLLIWGDWNDYWTGYIASTYIGDGYCNIAVLPIQGDIYSYGATFDESGNQNVSTNMRDAISFIQQAEQEEGILGVLALVDSYGGSAAAGDLITAELQKSTLPNAAYIVDSGTSAAYLIATGADTIIASPFSDVGSIGLTMSYLDYSQQNAQEGIEYIALSSGKFKDYGNPDKPLTEEERTLLERDLSVWHEILVQKVAENRDLPLEQVQSIADGSSVPGSLALDAGLVDAIGDFDTARAWFAQQLGLSPDEIILCN